MVKQFADLEDEAPMRKLAWLALLPVAGALTACGTNPPSRPTDQPSATPTATRHFTAAAPQPRTASAARSAAMNYFDLYSAGQYAAVYPMIDPADRAHIRRVVWTGVHRACRNQSTANLTYAVTHPVLAGSTAVLTVGFAGVASSLGSEQVTFLYADGKWYYRPSDMGVYRHHVLTQAIAEAKAEGFCS